MRLINVFILVFILVAFTIGAGLQDSERDIIDSALDNVSSTLYNISFTDQSNIANSSIPNFKGFFVVLEKGIHFGASIFIEVTRAGVYFGQDNPEYFEPEFMMKIIWWLIILAMVSLLITPVTYLIIFIVLFFMWIFDKGKKKKNLIRNKMKGGDK